MRQATRATIVAAVMVGAVSCSSTAPSAPIPFARLAAFPLFVSASSVSAGQQAIRDPDTWAAVWSDLTGKTSPGAPLPAVDFTRSVVLFTTMGPQPSSGYETSITAVKADPAGHLVVTLNQTAPGSGCVVAATITTPADAVIVPSDTAFSVDFEVTRSVT